MELLKTRTGFTRKCSFRKVELLRSETLGIGSYGKVCKAKCDNLVCAAKILHPTFFGTDDPRALERFKQECEFLRSITHPNIVQCLGTFQDAGGSQPLPVLLLELMDESLTHFLDRSKEPLSYFTEVTISHDVALALAFLHSNGYIHRDLSSNNILLIAGSRAKVADFGMHQLSHATFQGAVVYIPPEALREPPRYTDKIDTFSFGVVLVQILTRLFPNPGPPREVIDEVTERIVLETKRRENHIGLVDHKHPMLAMSLDCLRDVASDRPTASTLCDRLDDLKKSALYKVAEKRVSFAFFERELQDEGIKTSLVPEQKELNEAAIKREIEITQPIRKPKLQGTHSCDSDQPSSKDESMERHGSFLEHLDDWNLKLRKHTNSERQSKKQFNSPSSEPSPYEEPRPQDLTLLSGNSNTSTVPREKSPLSRSMSDSNLRSRQARKQPVEAKKYPVKAHERLKTTKSASVAQHRYYNIHPLTMQKDNDLVSRKKPHLTPLAKCSEEDYVIPDNDPDSLNFSRQRPAVTNCQSDEENDFEYVYPYMDPAALSTSHQPGDYDDIVSHARHEYTYIASDVVHGLSTRPQPSQQSTASSSDTQRTDPSLRRPIPKPRRNLHRKFD